MKNELNKNIDCLITKSIIVKKILAFHQHMNTYKPKFWRWFAVVCGGLAVFLTAHGHTDVLSSQILVVVCGGLRWFVVVCGGLWWFAVVCGGLWWIAVVCLLVIPLSNAWCRNIECMFSIAYHDLDKRVCALACKLYIRMHAHEHQGTHTCHSAYRLVNSTAPNLML